MAQLTYHGPIPSGREAVLIILHILLKAKRQTDGSYLVRTVAYAERPALQEGQDFAPVPSKLDITLQHEGQNGIWQPLQLSNLGVLQHQGPFVHEANVPEALAAEEFRLRVLDWPIYYTVRLPDIANLNPSGPVLNDHGPFRNAIAIGDIHITNVTLAAQVLATHMAHHFALGFDLYLLYARGAELMKALEANMVTAAFFANGMLQFVSLDALQIPLYDDGSSYEEMIKHRHDRSSSAYDSIKLIAYNHAALALWGERFRLAVLDIDEMWSSQDAFTTVNSWFDRCFPGSDVIRASRVNIICDVCLQSDVSELHYFQQNWQAADPSKVLRSFRRVTGFNKDPKSVFDPAKIGQVWLHAPFVLSGSVSTDVLIANAATDLALECAFVVHLRDLFGKRTQDASIMSDKHHQLVHS
ncbi:hypothetical protein WJX77_004185 [Trebouxia sp. C0004]